MPKTRKKKNRKDVSPAPKTSGWAIFFLLFVTFTGGFITALELQKGDPFQASRWLNSEETPRRKTVDTIPESKPTAERPAPVPAPAKPEPQTRKKTPQEIARPAPVPTPIAESTPEPQVAVVPEQPAEPELPAPAPTPSALKEGRLAIVIDDCGYSDNRGFVELPAPLTLAVLPHLAHSDRVARAGSANNKEILLHLPMEAMGDSDPGPGVLKTEMSDEQLKAELVRNFESVPKAVGLNNHQGSKATADPRVMNLVLNEAKQRQLFYLDSRTTNATAAPELAPKIGVHLYARDIFLDNVDAVEPILGQLRRAEEVARIKGQAVAIAHPRDNTLAALQRWLPEARVEIVPLSEL